MHELRTIKGDAKRVSRESIVRDRIADELGGVIEVQTKNGRIDIMTEREIIEIKSYKKWTAGIGQLLAYSDDVAVVGARQMRLHVFDAPEGEARLRIRETCEKRNIRVTFE